jgi:hypothetical protein
VLVGVVGLLIGCLIGGMIGVAIGHFGERGGDGHRHSRYDDRRPGDFGRPGFGPRQPGPVGPPAPAAPSPVPSRS